MPIQIVGPRDRKLQQHFQDAGVDIVNTTSTSRAWSQQLSPFFLGPVQLPSGQLAQNVENAWQYSKAYRHLGHIAPDGTLTDAYHLWSAAGFQKHRAERYPAGKGAIPEFSVDGDQRLGYIDARIRLYAPLYAAAVQKTPAFQMLQDALRQNVHLVLFDFDGYAFNSESELWKDVILNQQKKMGHAFVLGMLLDGKLESSLQLAARILQSQKMGSQKGLLAGPFSLKAVGGRGR